MMSSFAALGDRMGRSVVSNMVKTGRMERIVKEAIIDEFEKAALNPRYTTSQTAQLTRTAQRLRGELNQYREAREREWENLGWFDRIWMDREEFLR